MMSRFPFVVRMGAWLWLLSCVPAGAADAVVEQVEDGDTVIVRLQGQAQRLQLEGIDAPENTDNAKLQRDQERTGLSADALLVLGQAARQHLATLIPPGMAVKVEGNLSERDRYGRIPVVIYADNGQAMNDAMVRDGFAIVLQRAPLDAVFKQRLIALEAAAVTEQRGLWGEHSTAAQRWSGRAK